MNTQQESLETLSHIRHMMDRSSRFLSLSGWSGVAAGVCGLAGAWFAGSSLSKAEASQDNLVRYSDAEYVADASNIWANPLGRELITIALLTLVAALVLAFLFTWRRTKIDKVELWGPGTKRLIFSLALPLLVGGFFVIKLMQTGSYGLIAPACLLFYGLGLVAASKYTLGEIRWLGYGEIISGLICLQFPGNGLYFWAFGFGILHIIYGFAMWWNNERK